MFSLLKRFFDDIHRIANVLAANQMREVYVTLSADTENLLREIRWHRAKKEVA